MKRFIKLLTLAVGMLCSIHSIHAVPQNPYYQQALLSERVGFGQNATGGAGGQVWWVTNLNDSGSGSLREAATGNDARWILFAVSGNIFPATRIDVGSNKTIDGRGASISIFYRGMSVRSRNVIIENLNFKGGGSEIHDGVEILDGGGDVWIDHCSFNSWTDESIGITTPTASAYTDVTVSWCKFFNSEYGILIGGYPGIPNGQNMRVTIHHNWFNGTNQRHPRMRKALVHAYNNYLYNWLYHGMFTTDSGQLRVENNIFHAVRSTAAVTFQGGSEGNGFSNANNNWRVTGTEVILENQPNSVFWPANYYNFTAEAPDSALRTKIQTRAGATRTLGGFANMSTRANVQSGQGVLISGMYVSGPSGDTKKVVIRAIGPSLAPLIPGAMGNPVLRIYNSLGQQIAYNDNWGDTQYAVIQASGLAPSNSLEAAVLINLAPGSYSAVIDGWGTGIASVEVYDIDTSAPSKLVNISSRATVESSNPPIAGLIGDSALTKVILRGIGPSLASAGIQNPISDPTLTLHDANGTQVAYNNNWQDTQATAIQQTGVAPTDSRESAILIDLGPGSYTAILRNIWNVTGIGSIEAYKL